jgi:UDPglucose 6-dehydrogenase
MSNSEPVRLAVIGSGYVGTTVAASFAWVGHQVIGVEVDHHKLRSLRAGRAPFREPGLDRLLESGLSSGRLRFTDSTLDAVSEAEVVFLCIGAPLGHDGRPDMRMLDTAARSIGGVIANQVVVNKSTIPVGGARWLASIVQDGRPARWRANRVALVSNPEFMREGTATADFLHPHRVVLGSDDPAALDQIATVYRPILEQRFTGGRPQSRPVLVRTTPETAEMIKFASNAFLATKISFVNEVANICERVGADVGAVSSAMGLDPRIGPQFLAAGIGWGGSCLAKDLSELIATAQQCDYQPDLLAATMAVNRRQRGLVVKKLQERLRVLQGRRICLLGLAFKAGTDDLRDAPAIEVAHQLLDKGALVTAFDPAVTSLPTLGEVGLTLDAYQAADDADAVILLTEWPEFLDLDFGELRGRMRGDVFIDGRNCLNPAKMVASGFRYDCIGGSTGWSTDYGRTRATELDDIDLTGPESMPASWGNGLGVA